MPKKRVLAAIIITSCLVFLYLFNMALFSIKPDYFVVEKRSDTRGVTFTETIVDLMKHDLYGNGGWLPNDLLFSPAWFLDNKPNFQLGVLEVVRYTSRVLRDGLSRQRTTDAIDPDCDRAFTLFSNDPYKWLMPSAEGKYSKGIERLARYEDRLKYGNANFYPRSDDLIQLLEQYVSLLGGVNARLLNASRTYDTIGDNSSAGEGDGGKALFEKVPWTRIDDNFYYAQGIGYALYHLYKAIRIDFAPVLKDKNADIILQEIVASLEETFFEPLFITNGSKDGVFANHSNNLRVFLDDARQKSNSLIAILAQG